MLDLFSHLDSNDGYRALRDYQGDAVSAICKSLEEYQSTMAIMATGTGKTVVGADVAKHFKNTGRVFFLAHRDELINQAAKTIHQVTGIQPEIEKAEQWADLDKTRSPILVGSIQTLTGGLKGKGRMTRFRPDQFSLIIVDEAHHAPSETWTKVIDYFKTGKNTKILGLTATPKRTDELAMGRIFESCAYKFENIEASDAGWLVKPKSKIIYVEGLDFGDLSKVAGDFSSVELAALMCAEKPAHKVVTVALDIARGRRSLIFCVTVDHAIMTAEIYNRHEPGSAAVVYAKTPKDERRTILRRFRSGEIKYLCNCGVFTEGFDEPQVEVIVMARPTLSLLVYQQMLGRGLRPLPGILETCDDPASRIRAIAASQKQDCTVIDFTGNTGAHKLVSVADVLGGDYDSEVVDRVTQKIIGGDDSDIVQIMLEDEDRKRNDEIRLEQEERRSKIKAKSANYSSRVVDVMDIYDTDPIQQRGWDFVHMASDGQIEMISRMTGRRIDCSDWTRKQASALTRKLMASSRQKKATFGQRLALKKNGLPHDVKRETAASLLDACTYDGGWSIPPADVIETIMEAEASE